jgi:hypothetical protein
MNNKIKWVILVFILFIVTGLIPLRKEKKKKRKLSKKFEKLYNKQWDYYRIGDVFKWGKGLNYKSIKYHEEQFPDSIAAEYLTKIKDNERNDINLLKNILDNRPKLKNLPEKNSFVLHMRVGDVFCTRNMMSSRMGVKNMINHYTKKDNPDWWYNILAFMNEKNIDKLYIIVGSHSSECLLESSDFIMDRVNMFKKNDKYVFLRIGNSPDEDILWAQHAKNFATTGGGYGRLIGKCVKKNGGVLPFPE